MIASTGEVREWVKSNGIAFDGRSPGSREERDNGSPG